MSGSGRRIAILFHSGDRHRDVACYIVHHLAEFWRADGHEVVYLFGAKKFVAADIVLVHVNLSVVPDDYLELASRYPIALNGRVRDIRKTAVSSNLVRPGDKWDGPVIAKSDLNYAGVPERVLRRSWLERKWGPARRIERALARARGEAPPFDDSWDYAVYDTLGEVPEHMLKSDQVVIEKFRPEIEGGRYYNRIYQFLGNRWTCTRMSSENPIVKSRPGVETEDVEPHPDVVSWRESFGLDYGKIDYVESDGEAVILDVNKTTGASQNYIGAEKLIDSRRHRAQGLYAYFS